MERTNERSNFRIPTPAFDYSERSDATRVAPLIPKSAVRADVEINRPSLTQRRERARLAEEERRNAELAEAARKADEDRRKRNAEYYRQQREERERQRKQDDLERSKQTKINDAERDREKEDWVKDIEVHPENYSQADRDFLKVKKIASKLPTIGTFTSGLKYAVLGISDAWFGLKDMLGAGVLNSISINGENIQSRIGFNEQKKQAAEAHGMMTDLEQAIKELQIERGNFTATTGYNPEYAAAHPTDPEQKQLTDQYNQYTSSIRSLQAQMADPTLKTLDDAYKQLYSIRKAGITQTAKDVFHNFADQFTYDQYKGYVADKRAEERRNRYQTTLNEQYSDRMGFDRFRSKEEFEAQQIREYIDELDQENEQLRKDYEDNRVHLAESTDYWQVRDSYRRGEQLHQNDAVWNPEYWYYTMPGMMGSSMSSAAQARSMAIQGGSAVGAIAASATGLGFLAAPLLFAGQVLSTPDDLKAMYDENYGETGMKRLDNLETMLNDPSISKGDNKQIMDDLKAKSYAFWKQKGLSDDYLKEYLYGQEGNKNTLRDLAAGVIQSSDPRVTEALIESTRGLEAQLAANNVRTGAEMVVQKAIMMPGLKSLGRGIAQTIDKIGAGVAERQFTNRIVADGAGRVTARTATDAAERTAATSAGKYANGFRRTPKTLSESMAAGASAGAQAADAMGLGIAGQAIGGTIGAVTRGAGHIAKDLMSPRMRRVYETMEEAAMRKYQKIYDKLMPTKEWKKLALQYGVKTARAVAASSMSEAAEEAVQYLNEKEDFASKYGWSTPSIPDLIWNDLRQGGRVLNSYLSLLGITESELKDDQEYWANVKGGFALGGLHTAVMSAVSNATEAAGKYKVADAILKSSVMNRELDKLNRASNTELARQVMAGRAKNVEDMLRDMEAQDARRENPRFSQEDYDEKIKALRIIASVAKDKDIRASLEKSGITYGTERYAVAVADQYNLYEQLAENSRQRTANGGNIMQAYNTAEFNAAIEEAAQRAINQNETLRNLSETEKAAEKANMMQVIREGNHKINKLAALVQLRAQSNTIDDFYNNLSEKFGIKAMRPDAATIRKNIDKQLEEVVADMKEYDPDFDAKTDEEILDYIERTTENIAGIDNEQIQARERANAMLDADRAVILSYINQTGSEAYGRRIDAIIDATKRNASLDWMVNDIYEGDAVNRLMSVLQEEADKQATEAEKTAQNEKEEASEPFESEAPRQKDLKSAFAKNREKYQARKAKAKQRYQNRKKRYKDFKRGNLSATIVPFQDAIVSGANELLRLAEEGTYKFAQLIDDLRDISDNADLSDVIPELKRLYIKQRAKLAIKNPDALENMSTLDEVNQYISSTTDAGGHDDPVNTPLFKQIQDRLKEDERKIVDSVSSHYDVFVEDNGKVTIYRNLQAIQDSTSAVNTKQTADKLRLANTSEESFRNELARLAQNTPGFPVEDYIQYKDVDGVYEAIARNLANWTKGQSVRNGIKTQRAAIAILTGKGDQLNPAEYPANFAQFYQDMLDIKQKLEGNGLGLTIISTDKYIYQTLPDGSNIAVQADVIAADDKGKIYLIDIRTGYKSIHDRFTAKGASYRSIEEQTQALLKQAEDIISNKFRKPVTGTYLLPIIYNDYDTNGIKLDKTKEGRALIPIKLNNIPQHSNNLEEQQNRAANMVRSLNQKIDEYNAYLAEANKYSNNYTRIDSVPLQQYTTAAEYSHYMDNLTVQYNDVVSRLTQITQDIQKNINTENDALIEQIQATNLENMPTDVNAAVASLESACRELDLAMRYLPDMKATTQEERNAVRLIYSTLFDAQKKLDELLSMEEARSIDVTREEELIASILEKLAEHPENFDKSSMFVQNWWVNNFVIGRGNNAQNGVKSVSEQFAGFINTINSWVDTLHNHVVGELDNHRQLQIWYSTLLNNYFTVLLDNAEAFAAQQDASIQNPLRIVIEKGRNLVQQFNDTWGAPTDGQFDGPPANDVERINRMPVKWANLYNQSLYHSPAVDAMAINEIWYHMSTQPDFLQNAEVRFYIANRDSKYVNHSGQSYTIRKGDVAVFIKYKNNFVDFPLETNINNYPNASVEQIMRVAQLNRGNVRFAEKIRAMLDYVKQHPEYTIDYDITTDKGTVRYGDATEAHNVSEFLFADNLNSHDLYNIQISQRDNIGISVVVNNPNGSRFYDVRGGSGLKTHIGNFNDVYQKNDLQIQPGLLIYFYDTGNGQKIGIPLQSASIGVTDATNLTYLLHKYIQGERQIEGYDILSLLKQRLYIRDPKRYLTEYNRIGTMITIGNNGVTIGETFYNIVTQKNDIINAIAAMSNVVDVDMMNQNILQSTDPVLVSAYNRIRAGQNSVTLPNGITLTRDDFEHNGTGTTWLGYFMRNNTITTRAIGTGYKQINIGDPQLRLKSNDPVRPAAMPSQPTQTPLNSTNDPFDFVVPGAFMTIEGDSMVNRTEDQIEDFQKAVNDYFNRVLGENAGKISFSDSEKPYLTRISATQVAIGVTTDSLIEMSNYAPEAVAPHEAFHRIMEMLLPDEEREDFYKMYREHTKNGRGLDDRSVAEGLCDLFVDYTMRIADIKSSPWYKKFFKWCNHLLKMLGLAWRLGPKNMRTTLTMWHNVNAGEYAKLQYKVTQERIDRFNKLFDNKLYYEVKNKTNGHITNLQHIADSGQLSHMVRALGYYIMESKKISEIDPDFTSFKVDDTTPNLLLAEDSNGKPIMDNLCGVGLPDDQLTAAHLAFREIFESREQDVMKDDKKIATTRVYPNFDAIADKVAEYISTICGEYSGKVQEDEQEDVDDYGENIDVQNLNIDKYDKASYEINKLEGVNKKVKLFFATIPYTTRDKDGNIVLDTSRNIFGCPTYMPIDEVYNALVNDLHDARSIQDLYARLKKLKDVSTMHYMVLSKFHNLVKDMYKRDEHGNLVIDYDAEQFAIQITGTISSQKLDFIIANSTKLPGNRGKEIRINQSSLGRDKRQLPDQWSKFLLSGQVNVFARTRDTDDNIRFIDDKRYPNNTDIFSKTAQFFNDTREALSKSGEQTIDGVVYNVDSLEDINKIKKEIVHRLHVIGIIISDGMIDHMLLNNREISETADLGKNGLLNWLTQRGEESINPFIDALNNFVYANGTINQTLVKQGYSKLGFVKDLAKWQASYNRSTVDNRTLALNGKELHSISQNNAISRNIDAFNTLDTNNEVVRTLIKFGFNITPDVKPEGSIILKGIIHKDPNMKIQAHTYIGFKTDNRGDTGSEYTEEATVDDYMAKYTMLQEGYMLFPTLADKGTWIILSGVNIPGMKFTKLKVDGKEQTIVSNTPTVKFFNKMAYIVPPADQLNQMLEYAHTERLAIQHCMEDLGYENIPGYEKEGRAKISDEAKVKNYHTINKDKKTKKQIEPNGTRFLGLTQVTVKENGQLVTYNLNDPNKSSIDLLKLANDKFFSKSPEEQADIMALTLHVQNNAAVRRAVELGVAEFQDVSGTWTDANGIEHKQEFSASLGTYYTLDSKQLNQNQIEALTAEFMRILPHGEFGTWAGIPSQFTGENQVYAARAKDLKAEKDFRYRTARGLAIAAMINDVTVRHIISSEEAIRCFIGHPGFFKVDYDIANGIIRDSAYDIQKRIGGLISTGEDNITRLPGMPTTYVVAECNDYEVSSTSNVAPNLEEMFVNGNVREMYALKTGNWKKAYEAESADKLIEEAKGSLKQSLIDAKETGKEFADAFTGDINVADGAAYITDTMCENLLRMRGAYNGKVKRAFEILRSDAKWKDKQKAYKEVYDAVNIVPFKYTAYGFRDHTLNGDQITDLAVPYYDKFALFPLFNGIATGNLDSIYKKMQAEGVDELLMTSAVKVGSQGAVSYDGTTIPAKFNKYVQYYADLRRQLNTDPEEGDNITAGTQMIKIALQNLRLERNNYVDVRTGQPISGLELRDKLMQSINQLAISGAISIQNMFCKEGSTAIDPEKLSVYLNDQLNTRNANKAITEAIQVTTNPETGLKELVAPLAATPDASWIESIVISTVNKRIIDIITPGSSFTQRSVFAMEGKQQEGEGVIQSDANMDNTINNGEKLQMVNEDGSMDAVITMDYFDKLFGKYLNGMSFNQKRDWLIRHNVIGKGAKANTIGYRIPTQAQSSIHALRFVDVIPAAQATIILPEEFTKITGSDKHQCSNVKKPL